jgi:hypothetical protein
MQLPEKPLNISLPSLPKPEALDNFIVHPETGEKFDAETGEPILSDDSSSISETNSDGGGNILPEPVFEEGSYIQQPPSLPLPPIFSSEDDTENERPEELPTPQPDVIVHPETGEKFDAETGEPIIYEESTNNEISAEVEPETDEIEVEKNHVISSNAEELFDSKEISVEVSELKVRQSKWAAGGRPSEMKAKIPEIITVRDWDNNTEDDPIYGLGSEKEENEYKPKTNKKIILNERDFIMMNFMTKHRYCYSEQLARLVSAENKDIRARLARLEKEGYIRRETITRGQDLWLTKKAGLQIIGSPYNAIGKGQVSPAAIQHTIGVGNLAVELEMGEGAENILGEDDFPKTNRYLYGKYDPDSSPVLLGEMTISEREIRSANRVLRGGNNETTIDLKYKVQAAAADFSAPERLEGNEWMFAVYSKGEHFPDLVVSRPRDEQGKPQHIAIELELTAKDLPSWRRILKWYQQDGVMFSKVYYFTHVRTIATRVQKVVDELGLTDRVILRKYIPRNNRGPFWG